MYYINAVTGNNIVEIDRIQGRKGGPIKCLKIHICLAIFQTLFCVSTDNRQFVGQNIS